MANAAAFSGAYVSNLGPSVEGFLLPAGDDGWRVLLGGDGQGGAADPEVQRLREAPAPTAADVPAVPVDRSRLDDDVGQGDDLVLRRPPPAAAPALLGPRPVQRDRRRRSTKIRTSGSSGTW